MKKGKFDLKLGVPSCLVCTSGCVRSWGYFLLNLIFWKGKEKKKGERQGKEGDKERERDKKKGERQEKGRDKERRETRRGGETKNGKRE